MLTLIRCCGFTEVDNDGGFSVLLALFFVVGRLEVADPTFDLNIRDLVVIAVASDKSSLVVVAVKVVVGDSLLA